MTDHRAVSSILLLAALAVIPAAGCVTSDDQTAAEGPDEGVVESQVLAPSCIQRYVFPDARIIQLSSLCSTTQWVKIIIAFAADSSCFPIAPNQIISWSWQFGGSFDRLESC